MVIEMKSWRYLWKNSICISLDASEMYLPKVIFQKNSSNCSIVCPVEEINGDLLFMFSLEPTT